jgi:two-component system, OmpR family, sensor histidine kinase VicK
MRPMAQNQQIDLSAQKSDLLIYADRDRIIQCLTNLLSNAIKFSDPGGAVKIAVKSTTKDARFEVSDKGRGIPEGKKSLIFERFQQGDTSDSRKKGGTGLGLAISRNIVEQHGGKMWVESQLGKGSTFYFTVPLAQEQSSNVQVLHVNSGGELRSEREPNAETHPAD